MEKPRGALSFPEEDLSDDLPPDDLPPELFPAFSASGASANAGAVPTVSIKIRSSAFFTILHSFSSVVGSRLDVMINTIKFLNKHKKLNYIAIFDL
ncbi:hypothetical protein [Phyllobacterium brassicacearum]|uniref:hypothetical protein n=1 Tax=Phyllobacterium brassicacearum TaxID=314235 RepID=UPI00105B4CB0|nr:hypothetical protein [Phyllobacterium brassicacearum]